MKTVGKDGSVSPPVGRPYRVVLGAIAVASAGLELFARRREDPVTTRNVLGEGRRVTGGADPQQPVEIRLRLGVEGIVG